MLVAARNAKEEPAGVLEQYVEGSDCSMTPQTQVDTHSQQKSDEKCGLGMQSLHYGCKRQYVKNIRGA